MCSRSQATPKVPEAAQDSCPSNEPNPSRSVGYDTGCLNDAGKESGRCDKFCSVPQSCCWVLGRHGHRLLALLDKTALRANLAERVRWGALEGEAEQAGQEYLG